MNDNELKWSIKSTEKLLETAVFDVYGQEETSGAGISGLYIAVDAPEWGPYFCGKPDHAGGIIPAMKQVPGPCIIRRRTTADEDESGIKKKGKPDTDERGMECNASRGQFG